MVAADARTAITFSLKPTMRRTHQLQPPERQDPYSPLAPVIALGVHTPQHQHPWDGANEIDFSRFEKHVIRLR